MPEFTILPILGRRTDVPENHPSMFDYIGTGVAATHDCGGLNFDLQRKRSSCYKSKGYLKYSDSQISGSDKVQGLFEWYDGSRYVHVIVDTGRVYYYNSLLVPTQITDVSSTVYAATVQDLFSFAKVGAYMVFTDRGTTPPAKWSWGDANITPLVAGGSAGAAYTFRYIDTFQRRLLGFYSGNTNGDIDVRWTESWPGTAIASLTFPAANQLYIPNDDSIAGARSMGQDRFYIYCNDSIQELVYYPDFENPFQIYTAVPNQGAAGHHGIINLGDRHILFNKNYGFCEYRGGREFPYGGVSLSDKIESDIAGINSAYYNLMVGTYIPLIRKCVWAVNLSGESAPDHLLFYDLQTGDWTKENKAMPFIDAWQITPSYTWNDLCTALGGASSVWPDTASRVWSFYASERTQLVYANSNGYTYYQHGETLDSAAIDSYRVEPVLDFGDPKTMKMVKEIWFDLGVVGDYSIHIYHRMGQTLGEVLAQSWTSLGTVSCNSPNPPALRNFAKTARLHQFKWGTDGASEPYQVSKIVVKYEIRSEN